jgi:hypothetical protein
MKSRIYLKILRYYVYKDMEEGYLFCVGGDKLYYQLLRRVIESLRKFDTRRHICVLTDNVDHAKVFTEGFDKIIYKQFHVMNHIVDTVDPRNAWNLYGFYPKVFQVMYTPFQKTMYLDIDQVFKTDIQFIWDKFNDSSFCMIAPGVSDQNNCSPQDWHWGHIYGVIQRSGICVPMLNSSIMVYDRTFVKHFIKHIQPILTKLPMWGCLSNFRDGYPDEIVFALLMGILEIRPNAELWSWLTNIDNLLSCDKNL